MSEQKKTDHDLTDEEYDIWQEKQNVKRLNKEKKSREYAKTNALLYESYMRDKLREKGKTHKNFEAYKKSKEKGSKGGASKKRHRRKSRRKIHR